jgi:hypothetical protein
VSRLAASVRLPLIHRFISDRTEVGSSQTRLPVAAIGVTRENAYGEKLAEHAFARREVEAEEPSRLADSHSEVGRVLEFLSNALNEFAKEECRHRP